MGSRIGEASFHHYAVTVNDLDGMVKWYREVMGFREERRFILKEEGIEIVMLTVAGGLRLELLHRTAGGSAFHPTDLAKPGAKHICFKTGDVNAIGDEMNRLGVKLVQPPKIIPEAGVKNCWISDLEGNLIEFIEIMAP